MTVILWSDYDPIKVKVILRLGLLCYLLYCDVVVMQCKFVLFKSVTHIIKAVTLLFNELLCLCALLKNAGYASLAVFLFFFKAVNPLLSLDGEFELLIRIFHACEATNASLFKLTTCEVDC